MEGEIKLEIGKPYLFRTVTMIYTGILKQEKEDCFVINKAAWIADTGRWKQAVASGKFDEVEPYPPEKNVFVYKGGMLDIVEIDNPPLEQK